MRIASRGLRRLFVFLAVFILVYPSTLSAGGKKYGDHVTVFKTDGELLEGELLKVDEKELILLSNSESPVRVSLDEIEMVKYKKRTKFLTGAAVGLGISIVAGAILTQIYGDKNDGIDWKMGILWGTMCGVPVALLGGAITALSKNTRTLDFQAASSEEIEEIIKKLKSRARFN